MKKASELTQTVINNDIALILEELPENWHLKLILLYYKDVLGLTWGKIFIKFGCVNEDGLADYKKGERYKSIYKRLKAKKIEEEADCKAMV